MLILSSVSASLPALLLLARPSFGAVGLNCEHVVDKDVSWDLSKLGGEHALSWVHPLTPKIHNTTFSLDICKPLTRHGDKKRRCPNGSHICGVDDLISEDGEIEVEADEIIPIAGEYGLTSGHHLDPQWTRLKGSASAADKDKHGVRLEMKGRPYDNVDQRAYIEFLCLSEENAQGMTRDLARRDDNDEGDDEADGDEKDSGGDDSDFNEQHPDWLKQRTVDDGQGGSIAFQRYQLEERDGKFVKTLRLEWKTPFACENARDNPDLDDGSKGGWGFFSWFFFLAFMGAIVYFVFFAWINYTRYGATGWDMLPHSDTLRDIPYILGDWGRKVVNTVQGGGARGGYSAV